MAKNKLMNGLIVAALLVFIVVAGIVGYSYMKSQSATPNTNTQTNTPSGTPVALGCSQNPNYAYSAYDVFSTTLVGGTDQIKLNGQKPVNSLAGPTAGLPLQYWKSNSSYFCKSKDAGAVQCGSNSVQTDCFANSTSTALAVYDKVGKVTLTNGGGANNITIGANGNANLELSYQANAKQAAMPFGGCVAVETPNTITSVSVDGAGISTFKPCPYKWTYVVSSTSNIYQTFEVPKDFDSNGLGDYKTVALQMQSGASDPSGTAKITFQPANYYITNAGEIVLGIEKDKNQDTTKTFGTAPSTSFAIN